MRHFCHLCRQSMGASLTSYSEFPKSAKCFLDLYKGFAEGLDTENLKESLVDLYTTPGIETVVSRVRTSFPDFEKAIHSIVLGNDAQQLLGLRWLKADNIPLRDLRAIGIGQRLDTGQGAIKVISLLAELISSLGSGKNSVGRLVWVVDEFQLVGDCRQATIHEITGSLHSVFNRTPNNLTLFISFSGNPEKKFPSWVSRELTDRIGIERVILLPPLTTDEAVQFLCDVLHHFRAPEDRVTRPFPFEQETVHEILRLIQKSKCELKPRTLMQAFTTVLEEADPFVGAHVKVNKFEQRPVGRVGTQPRVAGG